MPKQLPTKLHKAHQIPKHPLLLETSCELCFQCAETYFDLEKDSVVFSKKFTQYAKIVVFFS